MKGQAGFHRQKDNRDLRLAYSVVLLGVLVFAKMPHGNACSVHCAHGRGAPCADLGLWRTATIDTKRRKGVPVRLFGGGQRKWTRELTP